MTRDEILRTAAQYVTQDRASTHGDAERNFQRIAEMWSAYLGVPVDSVDVASMMVLLKLARIKNNPQHLDNWVDVAGYAACGGELVSHDRETLHLIGEGDG